MTRDAIINAIQSKDDDWLESRWSVLDEAIKAIEPHLAAIEAAFDHDYTTGEEKDSLEKSVCDQVLELCCIVTTTDMDGKLSWGELFDLVDLEIKRREKLPQVPQEPGELIEIGDITDGVSMKIDPPAEKPSGILSHDPDEISELVCSFCQESSSRCPQCGGEPGSNYIPNA